jgi:hypothetical protein
MAERLQRSTLHHVHSVFTSVFIFLACRVHLTEFHIQVAFDQRFGIRSSP